MPLTQKVRRDVFCQSELMRKGFVCVSESQCVSRIGLGRYTWRLLQRSAINNQNIRETWLDGRP